MAFTPKTWANGSSGGTPITAIELNRIETGINDAHSGAAIHAATSKATPIDADELVVVDSAASFGLKKFTVANLKTWVKSWITKTDVGLGSVDNTADSAKNVLSATKLTTARTINGVGFDGTGNITVNAVDSTAREPAITAGTSAQYWRGDKTMATLNQDAVPDGTTNKAYTATEKTKLAGIATSATANDTDANLKNRANHTGTQTASTISDFNTAADARVTAGITGKVDKSTLTTKGDLYVATASGAVTRIGVGSDGQVVQADSTQTAGIKWATPAGGGDASTNTASSVDSEIALFSGTGGKTVKRATQTGLAKLTSGVLSAATDGTDYVSPKTAAVVSNVLASGADPTGATGDLGAIITSLASSLHTAGGGTIYVPPGTYRFTTTGTINSPLVSLQGAGANATHFVANSALGTNACLDISARTGFTVLYGGRFSGFSVDGTAATSGVGLRYGDMIRGHLDDIFIDNYTTGAALEFTNRTQWTERTLLTRITVGHSNRVGWRFAVSGGFDSFGHMRAVDCALNIAYVAATVTRTSVTTTAGSTSATVASGGFPSVTTGMSVDGVGLYGGTTVSAVASNTLTLSIPAKASGTVTLKFAAACQRGIVVESSAYLYNGELALIVNADSGTEGTNQAPVLFDVAGNVDGMLFLIQGEATTGKSTVANIASGGQINGTGFTVLYGFTAGYLGGNSSFVGDGDGFLFPTNALQLRKSVPGDNPMIIADGPDSDVAMVFQTKGNGAFVLWQDTGQTVARMFADGTANDVDFSLESKGAGSVKANGNVVVAPAMCRLDSVYRLSNVATVQKLFNSSANGRVNLARGTYRFNCLYSLSGMSATNGNSAFSLVAGSASLGTFLMQAIGIDGAAATAAALTGSTAITSAFPTSQHTAGTNANQQSYLTGTFEVTSAGTVIPSIQLVTASSTVDVAAGSFFECWRVGLDNVTTIGDWS